MVRVSRVSVSLPGVRETSLDGPIAIATPPAGQVLAWVAVLLPVLVEHFSMLADLLGDGLDVIQLADEVVIFNELLVEVAAALTLWAASVSVDAV